MNVDWSRLAKRIWIRRRWRSSGEDDDRCLICDAALNRPDTYYVRPAYTDGQSWICSGCFDRMKEASDENIDHRYGWRSANRKQREGSSDERDMKSDT